MLKIGDRVMANSTTQQFWRGKVGTVVSPNDGPPLGEGWNVELDDMEGRFWFSESELDQIRPVKPEKTKINVEINMKMSLNYDGLTDDQIDGLLFELMQEKVRRNNV